MEKVYFSTSVGILHRDDILLTTNERDCLTAFYTPSGMHFVITFMSTCFSCGFDLILTTKEKLPLLLYSVWHTFCNSLDFKLFFLRFCVTNSFW